MNTFAHDFTRFAFVGAAAHFAFAVLVRNYSCDRAQIAVVALAVGLEGDVISWVHGKELALKMRRKLGDLDAVIASDPLQLVAMLPQ